MQARQAGGMMGTTGYGHNTWETEILYLLFWRTFCTRQFWRERSCWVCTSTELQQLWGCRAWHCSTLEWGEKSSSTSGQQRKDKNTLQTRGHVLRKKKGREKLFMPCMMCCHLIADSIISCSDWQRRCLVCQFCIRHPRGVPARIQFPNNDTLMPWQEQWHCCGGLAVVHAKSSSTGSISITVSYKLQQILSSTWVKMHVQSINKKDDIALSLINGSAA